MSSKRKSLSCHRRGSQGEYSRKESNQVSLGLTFLSVSTTNSESSVETDKTLEYPTGEGLYEIYPRKRHEEVQAHFKHLLEMYPDDFLFVVRDNATSHTTAELDQFLLGNKERLVLVPLPTYSPHLNIIERLWHYMRDKITRSHFYETFKHLCEALVKWLQMLPFERCKSLMGVGLDP